MWNFDMTSVPVHTVDGESLSKITIHNFEKSKKKSKFEFSPIEGNLVDTCYHYNGVYKLYIRVLNQ